MTWKLRVERETALLGLVWSPGIYTGEDPFWADQLRNAGAKDEPQHDDVVRAPDEQEHVHASTMSDRVGGAGGEAAHGADRIPLRRRARDRR